MEEKDEIFSFQGMYRFSLQTNLSINIDARYREKSQSFSFALYILNALSLPFDIRVFAWCYFRFIKHGLCGKQMW